MEHKAYRMLLVEMKLLNVWTGKHSQRQSFSGQQMENKKQIDEMNN